MRRGLAGPVVALAGLGTSFGTALVVAVVGSLTTFNVFTFSLWLVLPVGAIACGFAAASGYYFTSKYLHYRPGLIILALMVAGAAAAQLLIYWLEYRFMQVGTAYVSDTMSFYDYLDRSLTTSHIRAGRTAADSGPIGSFGYWLAAIQFLGFLIGSILSFLMLRTHPSCSACSKYRQLLLEKSDEFSSRDHFLDHYHDLHAHQIGSREFYDRFWGGNSVHIETGTIRLRHTIYECPDCYGQTLQEVGEVFNGQDWKSVRGLSRSVAVPPGIDLQVMPQVEE